MKWTVYSNFCFENVVICNDPSILWLSTCRDFGLGFSSIFEKINDRNPRVINLLKDSVDLFRFLDKYFYMSLDIHSILIVNLEQVILPYPTMRLYTIPFNRLEKFDLVGFQSNDFSNLKLTVEHIQSLIEIAKMYTE